jgi:hypothetical protein
MTIHNTSPQLQQKIDISIAAWQDLNQKNYKTFYKKSVNLDEFLKVITTKIWSPIVFNDNHRREISFLSSELIGLDFDNGKLTVDEAINCLKEWNAFGLVGTTKSHQKPKSGFEACDRFRLILFAGHTCKNLAQYKYNMKEFINRLPADKACKGGAQYFKPCEEIVYFHQGDKVDWCIPPPPCPEKEKKKAAATAKLKAKGQVPGWVKYRLKNGAGIGERHNYVYAIGACLTEFGVSLEEIVSAIINSPLGQIGEKDVREAVWYARRKALECPKLTPNVGEYARR